MEGSFLLGLYAASLDAARVLRRVFACAVGRGGRYLKPSGGRASHAVGFVLAMPKWRGVLLPASVGSKTEPSAIIPDVHYL